MAPQRVVPPARSPRVHARPARHGRYGVFFAFWLWALTACGDPCRELSDSVCRCAVTRADEQRCLRHVRSLASQKTNAKSALSQQRCAALQATCTCEALAAGNLAACGLTEAAP